MANGLETVAIRRFVKNSNGKMTPIFIDYNTGKRISDLKDYFVYDEADLKEMGVVVSEKNTPEEKKQNDTKLKRVIEGKGDYYSGTSRDNPLEKSDRSVGNNYGYIDKPAAIKYSGMLPGPLGTVGKVANAAINMNNKKAVSLAREGVGLEKKTDWTGPIGDNKGYVGDITYGDATTSVGLEAEDKNKRTTLTPNEARMRVQLAGAKEATKEEKEASIKSAKAANPKKGIGGIAGRFFEKVKSPFASSDPVQEVKDGNPIKREVKPDTVRTTPVTRETLSEMEESEAETPRTGGLASLSPSFNKGISYTHPERGPVNQGLNERTVGVMDALSLQSPEGIRVTSAYRDPDLNKSIGGAPASMHITGEAFDVSTRGLTERQKRDLVERAVMSGTEEMGTYADESLHFASRQRFPSVNPATGEQQPTGGVTAMHNRSRLGYDNAPNWFKDGLEVSRLAPTPEAKPEQDPVAMAGTTVQNPSGFMNQFSPEQREAYTADERQKMAMTLAGEIDLRKTDLSTEEGQQEARAILSTIENRVAKYGTVDKVLSAPNQYSTWNNKKAANIAITNYKNDPTTYDTLVGGYLSDPESNLGFTSYHADHVNPGWSSAMQGQTQIGPHKFGTLSEYGSGFGQNFSPTADSQKDPITRQQPTNVASVTTDVSPSRSMSNDSLNRQQESMNRNTGSMSDENANRSTSSKSTESRGGGFTSDNSGSRSSMTSGVSRDTPSRSSFSSSPSSGKSSGITARSSPSSGFASRTTESKTSTKSTSSHGYSGSRSDGWS